MKKLIIFDFDGTIADALNLSFEIFNGLSEKYNFKGIKNLQEYRNLFDSSLPRIIWQLKISPFKLPLVIDEGREIASKRLYEVNLFPGIEKAADELSKECTLAIISSNLTSIITQFLNNHNISKYFNLIVGSEKEKDKSKKIRYCLDYYKISPRETVLIGDTTRDIKDAKKYGLKTIAVSYGFHSKEKLSKEFPDALVDSPHQIIEAVNKIL